MRQKINLQLVGIAVLAILATTVSIILVCYSLFTAQVKDDLKAEARLLEEMGIFHDGITDALAGFDDELRITWIAEDGTVLYDNDINASKLENHSNRPEIADAMSSGRGESVRTSDTMGMNTYYYAIRLSDGSILRIARQAFNMSSIFGRVIPLIVVLLVGITALCTMLAHFLTKSIISPIEDLGENIDHIKEERIYKELKPFARTIRSQHENILAAAKSRQDFTANVTHELKTPITTISGYAELMENRMVDYETGVRFAGEIDRQAKRLSNLVNDIIRLSELDQIGEEFSFLNFDLFTVSKKVCDSMQVTAHENSISLSCEGKSLFIHGNRELIEELMENLISNAIRYNSRGGFVKVFAGLSEGHTVFRVEDNGIGIPLVDRERVFERFYRVDKSRSRKSGGTGLGLAIVKHIAMIHGAEISLDSEVGKGTCITVFFD